MRMSEGRETFNRLLNWDRGQAPSERLAAIILSKEGFNGVDPSHPLGGKDGLKDMTLTEWEKGQLAIRSCFGTLFPSAPWRRPAYGSIERVG